MTKYFRQFPCLGGFLAFGLALGCSAALAQTTQEHVHHMGASVMPFDLAKTTHIFRMTDTGGVQRVIVKTASETDQIAMIQQHLKHEAEASSVANTLTQPRCMVPGCRG